MRTSPLAGFPWWLVPALAASLAAVGCGPSTGTITGPVTYNGTTVKGGTVTFITADDHPFTTQIDKDGKYTLEKVPAGDVKITVETKSLAAAANAPVPPGPANNPNASNAADAKARYVKIPDIYGDPKTTTLTYTVKPGSQEYPLTLK